MAEIVLQIRPELAADGRRRAPGPPFWESCTFCSLNHLRQQIPGLDIPQPAEERVPTRAQLVHQGDSSLRLRVKDVGGAEGIGNQNRQLEVSGLNPVRSDN